MRCDYGPPMIYGVVVVVIVLVVVVVVVVAVTIEVVIRGHAMILLSAGASTTVKQ